MKVRVKLFAAARQAVGDDQIELDLPPGATIGQLRTALAERHGTLQPIARAAMFAVDTDYAADDRVLDEQSEVACIPPVSGG